MGRNKRDVGNRKLGGSNPTVRHKWTMTLGTRGQQEHVFVLHNIFAINS